MPVKLTAQIMRDHWFPIVSRWKRSPEAEKRLVENWKKLFSDPPPKSEPPAKEQGAE